MAMRRLGTGSAALTVSAQGFGCMGMTANYASTYSPPPHGSDSESEHAVPYPAPTPTQTCTRRCTGARQHGIRWEFHCICVRARLAVADQRVGTLREGGVDERQKERVKVP